MQIVDDELPQCFFLLGNDAHPALDAVVEDEMIQHDAVEVSTKNAQHHRLFIVDKGGRERHAHARKRHGLAQLHVQVLVHDLCHNIQPAGGCVAVEQNAQTHADHQNIAQHIQFLTIGHGAKIREQPLEKPQKYRQHHAGIHGFCSKLPAAGEKTDDEQHGIQHHSNSRKWQRHKIRKHDAKAGNTADGCVAGHQKKIDRRRNNGNGPGQDGRFLGNCRVVQLLVCHCCSSKLLFSAFSIPCFALAGKHRGAK